MTSADAVSAPRWTPQGEPCALSPEELLGATRRIRETAHIVQEGAQGRVGVSFRGAFDPTGQSPYLHLASVPPLYPEWLGDRAFTEVHGLRFPYVGGAMANGIASPEMVIALARSGMLGMLGTAGLSLERMTDYLDRTIAAVGREASWGANLIHSPQQPALEMATVELFLSRDVRRVSASAFMKLTPAVVRYAATGLRRLKDGSVLRRHHIFAKISRPEVAAHFMNPPPQRILDALVEAGHLSADEAELASALPVAEDLIVESDSGGHTDNRPLSALFPVIATLRDTICRDRGYPRAIRLGAAGGIGTPSAAAAAFAMGASFIVTGSINQASLEAAQSPQAKALLSQAAFSDVTMAPAGDMFEMGVEVQVLKRGTFFASRAHQLYQIYSTYGSVDELPRELRAKVERQIFQADLDEIWAQTVDFFAEEDPEQIERAHSDPRHKLALICRWYLGLSSKWPLQGDEARRMDYQIWMGPAQGAFNDWVRGSYLEDLENRGVVQMALNILEGASIITRAQQLRCFGAAIPTSAFDTRPQPLSTQ